MICMLLRHVAVAAVFRLQTLQINNQQSQLGNKPHSTVKQYNTVQTYFVMKSIKQCQHTTP